MSEKLYRCLLSLYPSKFREEYGEHALQVFLDRSRDEQGVCLRARFWFDLLIDLFISIPAEYRRSRTPKLVAAIPNELQNGYGVFGFVGQRGLPLHWIFVGGLLSFFSLFLLLTLASYRIQGEWIGNPGTPMQSADFWRSVAPRQLLPWASPDNAEVVVLGKPQSERYEHHQAAASRPADGLWSLLVMRFHSEPARPEDRDTPASEAFWKWFDAFNSGDQKTLETYLRGFQPEDSVRSELKLRTLTGGFRLQAVITSERHLIQVLLRDKNSWTRYLASIRTAAGTEPPKIVSLHLGQIPKDADIEESPLN